MTLREQLIRDEDRRLKPYLDCCGKYWRECECKHKGRLTVGAGRNLDDRGLTHAETLYLLDNDIREFTKELMEKLPWTATLDDARFGALVNLAFNMGVDGLRNSNPKMLLNLRVGRYAEAAAELLDGPYKDQVGARAHRLAKQIEKGIWQ